MCIHQGPLCQCVQEPDLAASVAAVYTWGEPRVGDSKFRDVFNAAYGDRCFRIRNAGQTTHGKDARVRALMWHVLDPRLETFTPWRPTAGWPPGSHLQALHAHSSHWVVSA